MPDGAASLTLTSPPYCISKDYESAKSVEEFEEFHGRLIPEIVRLTRPGGSICWQVGYHTRGNAAITPLDYIAYQIFSHHKSLTLRNRIIWTFGHGTHCKARFSPRHEVILWFTKSTKEGQGYTFNLDDVRVPQKYPGKTHYKGDSKGALSGNPLGKNPEDVWDIPNVKASHVEKTDHPCQFPVGLAQRLIRALTSPGELVLDPCVGSGTTGAAAVLENRRFAGAEIARDYLKIAHSRIMDAADGRLRYRDGNRPVRVPSPGERVARKPPHFT